MAFSVPTGSRRQAGQEEGLNLTRLKCGEPASVITAGRPIVCGDPFGSPVPQRPQPLDIPLRVGEIIRQERPAGNPLPDRLSYLQISGYIYFAVTSHISGQRV